MIPILDSPKSLARRGQAHFVKGRWSEAQRCFQRAIKSNPDEGLYYQWLGETEARLGNWKPAVDNYREALKHDVNIGVEFYRDLPVKAADPVQNHIKNPLFIVGCGHSGTSIMLALLGNHPALYPIPEESALFLKTDDNAQKQMAEWDNQCAAEGKARWIEKTPPHIFQIARFLKLRPEAQVLVMLRDGRDTVCSLKHRVQYKSVQDRLDRWIYDNAAALPYWDHPQVKLVKYEALIEAPDKVLAEICEFLGEDYSDAMLRYHEREHLWYSDHVEKPGDVQTHDDHNKLRNWQINQPLFDGRGRWKDDLDSSERASFKSSLAQKYLEKFGYANNADW